MISPSTHPCPQWLSNAIFYEIYPQSFADSNGDGIGDIPGITAKLGYITDLGMCGDTSGVLGVKSECVISDFTTKVHMRFEGAEGHFAACGALFTLDTRTRCVTEVKRICTCKTETGMI